MLYLPCTTLAVVCALALSGSPANAQPGHDREAVPACAVELVRVPDDVRGAVEAWIRAEPRCSHALEVRIIPTEGGLYVLARDATGRFHERVVPDATSAGALIVSWAADDGPAARGQLDASGVQRPQNAAPPRPAPATVLVLPSARAAAPPRADAAPEDIRAGDRPRPDLGLATTAPRTPYPFAPRTPRWMSAAAMYQVAARGAASGETLYGGRVGLELWTPGRWTIGAAVTLARSERGGYLDKGTGSVRDTLVRSFDTSAVLRAGIVARFGAWELAPSIGAGWLYSYNYVRRYPYTERRSTISAIGEASLTAAYQVSRRLAIDTGLLATVYAPTSAANAAVDREYHVERTAGVAVIQGLRWAL